MTQDPTHAGLSSDKVAELEHKLADAAAEVARVQAELQQAQRAVDPAPPSTGVPGSTIPPVPYGAASSSPHVITINGQQVAPGSGNLAAVLQQLGQAGAAAGAAAPVVMVNGQNVSGQPLDISSYLTPEVTQQIQSSLQALGLDQGLGAMFGHVGAAGAPPDPPEVVAPLAEPPRHVPMSYRLATFNLSVYELFILLIGFIAPIAVWMFLPIVIPGALIAAVLVIGWFRGRRYVGRIGMLKWGKVATVADNDTLDKGTYYGGVTYNNMRKRTATGWNAKTIWYSGPAYKNKVDYTLDGATGSLEWRGLRYQQGVIFADSRKPSRAMEVSMFPYSVKPGPDGQFTGELSAWLWGGIMSTLVIEVTWSTSRCRAVLDLWVNRWQRLLPRRNYLRTRRSRSASYAGRQASATVASCGREVDLSGAVRREAGRGEHGVVPVRRPDAVGVPRTGGQASIRSVKSMPSQSQSQRRWYSGSWRKSAASMTGTSRPAASQRDISHCCWSSPMSSGSQASRERT